MLPEQLRMHRHHFVQGELLLDLGPTSEGKVGRSASSLI